MPVAMVVAAAGMAVFYFASGAGAGALRSPMFLFFPVLMLISLLGTVAYGARGSARGAELDESRREYLRYLDSVDLAAVQAADQQRHGLAWSHPPPQALWTLAGGPRMWERRPVDDDFGEIRLGIMDFPLCTELVAAPVDPVDEPDPVTTAALARLLRVRGVVAGLPCTVRVADHRRINVIGAAEAVRAVVRAMVCQLATFHQPGDLGIAVVADSVDTEWDWLKWLPHYRSAGCGTGPVITVVDSRAQPDPEPGEIAAIGCLGQLDGPEPVIEVDGNEIPCCPDGMTLVEAQACARWIGRFAARGTAAAGGPTPWPQLLGIADPDRVDPAALWSGPRRRLRVPIGHAGGRVVELDLKEAAQQGMGPHGLCIGATGSGKSEFLRTLTLGLVATHPPEELNLVLVDFKGGATFLGFEQLRHVASVITNLADEAPLVDRMKDALAGEVNRRQELLRAAGNFASLADYDRARGAGAALRPLPALLVIVDEFSELLSRHPDFAELFVALGRVGRSLGIHLLLASQRLDEGRLRGLENHLSYRICLKTLSAAESRAVIGVPDAHQLPNEPGAAYLRTAAGDLTLFHSAYVSGRQHRAEPHPPPARPRLFTAASPPPEEVSRGAPVATPGLLDSIVGRLAGHGTPAHPVWLPPLREPPPLDALIPHAPAGLAVAIGLVDRPFEQRHDPLVVSLGGAAGNVAVVGGPQAGKSTALQTLILALAAGHDPADVQIYGLDFGGGALAALRGLPHVGAVAGRSEPDLVRRTVAQLTSIVAGRQQARGDGQAGNADGWGRVFLVIDGWAVIRQDFDTLEAAVAALAGQGLAVGVHVVIASSRWADIRPSLKDALGTRIELRLGDPAESEMDRRRARLLADCPPGRGLTSTGHEMTIALPRLDAVGSAGGLTEATAAAVGEVSRRHRRRAPAIELLPARVGLEQLDTRRCSPTTLGLGLRESDLATVTIDFARQPGLLVLGDTQCGKSATLRTLCAGILRTCTPDEAMLMVVDYRRSLLGVVESAHLLGYAISGPAVSAQLQAVMEVLTRRLPGEDVTQRQLRERSWWSGPEIYLVIDDYDLVAGASASPSSPLTPVVDLLPHAADVGLHVLLARRSGGAARAMFDPMLARLRDLGAMGLLMSAGPEDGPLLGAVRPVRLPPGRASLISRDRPEQLIQVAWCDPPT